jgi:recombination protein RecT
MANEISNVKSLFSRDDVKQKFKEMLGQKSTSFITSVLQITAQNSLLAKADPMSIYQSAAVAATLDLPLNNNLGFAYIVPYNDKQRGQVAQFQMGYKGFIQLAQRSGQFKSIYSSAIYEGQILEANPLDGYKFDFSNKTSDVIIGYAAKFTLINGFEATYYMSIDQLRKHGNQYSQTFKKGFGLWKDNFDAMATKTVLKLLLSKFAPLSVDMQRAVVTDQAIVNDYETEDVTYIDNEPVVIDKEAERIELMISDATTISELENIKPHIKPNQFDMYEDKLKSIQKK